MKLANLQENLRKARRLHSTKQIQEAHRDIQRFVRRQKPARCANGTRIRF